MGHPTITLTLDRYTHALKSDEIEALHKLPGLSSSGDDAALATSTYDAPPATESRGAIRGREWVNSTQICDQ